MDLNIISMNWMQETHSQLIEKSIEIADEDIEDCLNEIEELKRLRLN